MKTSNRKLLVAACTAALLAVVSPAGATRSSLGSIATDLPSVVPPSVRSLVKVADVPATAPVSFSVLIRGKNDAALPALARAVSDPASPAFRQFLTRAQTIALLDPSPATTAIVKAGLLALGAKVTRVSSDGRLIDATAPAGVLSARMDIRFAMVKAGGLLERVALNQPALPSAWGRFVADIVGLSQTPARSFASTPVEVTTAPAPAYMNGRPCAAYYGQTFATAQPPYRGKAQPYTICGYSPAQIRAAYRIPQTGLTGKGVHIGIVDDYSSRTMVADLDHYSALHGLPQLQPGQYVDHTDPITQNMPEVLVNDPTGNVGTLPVESPQEWSNEQTLDVEMVHTIAPGATIDYYGGVQGIGLQPLEAEFTQVIADDAVQFVSNSWGVFELYPLLTPADAQLMETMLQIGSIEGIGASFSSGDSGDNIEGNDVRSADFPSSTDMATSVGGTTLVVGARNAYVGETYWGTRAEPETANHKGWDATRRSSGLGPATGPGTLAGAGGGGISSLFAEPSWQKGIVPPALTTQKYTSPDGQNTNNIASPGRVTPDISLVGDSTTGVLLGQTQTDVDGVARYSEFRIGGTSVSSPLFAGIMALAIQLNGGKSLGFVNPAMYAAYKLSPRAFRDPSLGRNLVNVRTDYKNTQDPHSGLVYHLRLLGQLSSLHDLRGYDDSTGLGTPCASAFIRALIRPTVNVGSAPGC
ncbi:MAG TPA: S53 family peptidase [Actinomycetota bacterium]|nr:S53 family peptidase [Actinomycetota bacterium]